MSSELDAVHDQVSQVSTKNLKKSGWLVHAVSIAAAFAVGLSTFLQFVAAEKWLPSHIVGMTVSMVALVLTAIIVFANKDSSVEIDAARQALRTAEKIDKELMQEKSSQALLNQKNSEEVNLALGRLHESNQMLEPMRWMQESIEQSIGQPNTSAAEAVSRTLAAGEPRLKLSLSFETRQHYTLDVYEARKSNGNTRLHLIAHIRSTKCDMSKARVWNLGEGVVGHCQARNRPVIISDATEPSVDSIVMNTASDVDTYRSFAAFPIRAGKPEDVWGVVIATNSDPYFFDASEPDNRGATSPAGRIKLLAGLMGLVVEIHKSSPDGGAGQPGDAVPASTEPPAADTPGEPAS